MNNISRMRILQGRKSLSKSVTKKQDKRSISKFEELMSFTFENQQIPQNRGVKSRVKFKKLNFSNDKKVKFALPNV